MNAIYTAIPSTNVETASTTATFTWNMQALPVASKNALSNQVIREGIRVNQVAPGPIWTPLILAMIGDHDPEDVVEFGQDVLMGQPGQLSEISPAYVYLISEDFSYMSSQTSLNGGTVLNG